MTDDTHPENIESQVVSITLISLILLPCSLELLELRFLDGPGMGAILTPIDFGVAAICCAISALGFARLFALRRFARLAMVILLGAVLFAVSRFVTFVVAWFLFAPRC